MITDDTLIVIKRFLAWFLPSTLGVAAKLAFQSAIQKLSWKRILTGLIMACFAGYIADAICTKYSIIDLRGVVVAIAALGSESLIAFIFKYDTRIIKAFILRVLNINLDKPKKNEKDS